MSDTPTPSNVVRIEVHEGYRFVDIKGGHMTEPLRMLETRGVGKCAAPYRIDEAHPEYGNVKAAIQSGDRSVLFCYHKPAR